ncbi:MAG: coniferyl aldehyde dehydrogenase [Gemmatimonadaceae bacterium]
MDDVSLNTLLQRQRAAFKAEARSYERRMNALAALRDALLAREGDLAAAISDDFGGRPPSETRLLELVLIVDLIRHARRALRGWMKPRRAATTWLLLPSRAFTMYQPLGVVGIMGAWNYPLMLTFGPLVDAIAAGNHTMLKLPEMTPRTSATIAELVADTFRTEYITTVEGDASVSAAFAKLPFDHLLFTGSTRVGSLVMRAASENLTPVTLELGGKSPAIIHESYSLEAALRRIIIGKLYNAGQTCIAPDYVLVPKGSERDVERLARTIVAEFYPRLVDNGDYTRLIDRAHYSRLQTTVRDAQERGARVVVINPANEECSVENRVFPPTLIFDPTPDVAAMTDELFGPVLPIVPYDDLDAAIRFVNERPHPLALYYFDGDRRRIDQVIRETTSGGVTINDVLVHIAQHSLPFGGVGASGMGQYHGFDGFERFSKKKGVMVQARLRATAGFTPPFNERKRALLARILALAKGIGPFK